MEVVLGNIFSTPPAFLTNQSDSDLYAHFLEKVTTCLWWSLGSLILLVGVVGNFLVVLVILMKSSLRANTNGLLLLVLALVDLTVLLTGHLRHWLYHTFEVNVRLVSDLSCKVHLYLTYSSALMESWVLISLTIERLVAVFMPHRARLLCTWARASIALAVILAAILLLSIPYLWLFGLWKDEEGSGVLIISEDWKDVIHKDPNDAACTVDPDYEHVQRAYDWVHFTLHSAVPFAIMAVSNTAIAVKIILKLKHKKESTLRSRRSRKHFNNPTCLLLMVTSIFIICSAPYCIFISLVNMHLLNSVETPTELAQLHLMETCLALLNYTNYSINFILYCLMGTRFRRAFLTMCHHHRRPKVAPLPRQDSRTTIYI